MRPAFPVIACVLVLGPGLANAQDAKLAYLSKQLESAKDARLRVQTVNLLGATGNPAAAGPLCKALKDREVVVRTSAANALGELKAAEAQGCLQSAAGDADSGVKAAVARALAAGVVKAGALYVNLEPILDKGANVAPEIIALADKLLRDKLKALGAGLSPAGEEKKAAAALVRTRQLKGYQLRVQLLPNGPGLILEMLVMTYPDQELKASFNVKAKGGKHETLLKAMVPRVVDDAAASPDLQWK